MALVKCKECGEKISKKAKECPHCGAPVKKKTSLFTWIVTFFIAWLVFYTFFIAEPGPSTSSTERTPPVETSQESGAERNGNNEIGPNHNAVMSRFKGSEEPTAKDAVWTSEKVFKVGVVDDGTRRDGYAAYICQVLYDYGFKGKEIWVQIVDIGKLVQSGKWKKLGEAYCD